MGGITLPYMERGKENLRPSPRIHDEREGANFVGRRLGAVGLRLSTAQESRSVVGCGKRPEEEDSRPSRYLIFDRSRFSNCGRVAKRGRDERLPSVREWKHRKVRDLSSERDMKEGMGGRRGKRKTPRGGKGEEEEGVGKAD